MIITEADPGQSGSGFFPLMAGCSDGQIGALKAGSFAGRVISGPNPVITNSNTLLGDKTPELVVLRENRKFTGFMWR